MTLHKVKHELGHMVTYDTSTGEYFLTPEDMAQFRDSKSTFKAETGRIFNYHKTLNSFIASGDKTSIVPCFCTYRGNKHPKKNKYYKRLIYSLSFSDKDLVFFESEHTGKMWESHNLELVTPYVAYFLYMEKCERFDNEVRIISAMEIKTPAS